MLFTIKRPKSQRFFQLNFSGFRPDGRNKIEKILSILSEFFASVQVYLLKKVLLLVLLPGKLIIQGNKSLSSLKAFTIRKLIWSRGRLGRPIATFVVMNAAFLVFIFGEVFNSSRLVNSQELDKDYLSNVTDIIPQRNVATTELPEDRKRTEPITYIVEEGDTLSSIGSKFKISTDALRYVNTLTDTSYLKIGQALVIPPISGLIHTVSRGDTLRSISVKYDVPMQAVADFNYILDTSKLAVGTELVIPGAKVPQAIVAAIIPAQIIGSVDTGANKNWCIWPTTARIITQYFSWYHNGLDIATPTNGGMPPIYACSGGTVYRAGWDPWGLGLHVRIRHDNGYETIYGHLSRLDVGYGEEVSRGQVIGVMGSTGRSTGPHIHFIIEYKGVPQNPLNYIN